MIKSSNSPKKSQPKVTDTTVCEPVFRPWLFWLGIGTLCLVAIAASITSQKLLKERNTVYSELPKFYHIEQDLEAQERDGRTVRLSDLNGKVRVYAYIYTVCPHGCASIIGEMLKLEKQFGKRQDFHQISVSVVPERDTVAMMSAYAEGIGVKPGSPWWFLTGDREKLWSFMTNSLKLEPAEPIPEEEQLNPLDLYTHDLRMVLVDRNGFVRGYYAVFHPQFEIANLMAERLQQDVRRLLDDPNL